jgi:hypothetical protein
MLFCTALITAQDIDAKVKKAVNDLIVSARINVQLQVSIEPVNISNTGSVSEFSGYLTSKIAQHATNNRMYQVVPGTRTILKARNSNQSGTNTPRGKIEGTFTRLGNLIEVTIYLISETNNMRLASNSFTIPVADIEQMGLALLPANIKTQGEVLAREEVFEAYQGKNNAFALDAWPDASNRVYQEGDTMFISLVANQDCYFVVYQVNVENRRQVLYPNIYDQEKGNNKLKAGEVRQIPERSIFRIGGPHFGEERILVFASDTPIDLDYTPTRDIGSLPTIRDIYVDPKAAQKEFTYTTIPRK